MTTGIFKHIDLTSHVTVDQHFVKPWTKVDDGGRSYQHLEVERPVSDMRQHDPSSFGIDLTGFAAYTSPAREKAFTDDAQVRASYYPDVEALLRAKLPGISRVVIFDHTIRRRAPGAPRQPVQQVHVDQTPAAAAARVRRHVPAADADALLRGRYQIVNVWRPIGHAAADFPLALVDWRSTRPRDFVRVDLLYPKRGGGDGDDDDRGKEALPAGRDPLDVEGYEVRGETYGVAPSESHRFWYMKDMTPDEAMFIKCFDSWSENVGGQKGLAGMTPHTAFVDPNTPEGAKGRQSIEVRCLVFYE